MRYNTMSPWFLPQLLFWLTVALAFLERSLSKWETVTPKKWPVLSYFAAMLGSSGQFMLTIAPTNGAKSVLSGLTIVAWSMSAVAFLLAWLQRDLSGGLATEVEVSPLLKDPLIMLNGTGEVVYSNMSLDWEAAILRRHPSSEEWQWGEQTFLLRELPLKREGVELGKLLLLQDISSEKVLMAEWTRRSEELQQVQRQLQEAFRVDEALMLAEQQRHLAEQLQVEVQHKLEALIVKSNLASEVPEIPKQREALRELADGLRELLQQIRSLVDGGMRHDADSNCR